MRSLFVKKQKDFSDQKCIDSQSAGRKKKSLTGDWWCRTNVMSVKKTERKFLRLASGALLVSQVTLSEKTRRQKFCWCVNFSQWKGEFWIQDVIRAHLDTCLLLTSSREAA